MKVINIPESGRKVINTLQNNGYEAFVVGGCVRDSLLGKTPEDWDITTSATPDKIVKCFQGAEYRTIKTGIKHGTITVVLDNDKYEITTYRVDGEYSDNRRPDNVSFTSVLEEDLRRRDFTVNAMAYNDETGIIDAFGGYSDLGYKVLRAVGNADERLKEDALRMMRAVRFSAQLGFVIDSEELMPAIKRNCKLINNISAERVRDELNKILTSQIPGKGMRTLHTCGLLEVILPEIMPAIGFNQHTIHHDKDVFEHILAAIDNTPATLPLRLSALLHDIGKPHCFTIGADGKGHFYGHHKISAEIAGVVMKRLRYDSKLIEKVVVLVSEHMSRYDKLRDPNIKKFINKVGVENLQELFQLQTADIKASANWQTKLVKVQELKAKCDTIIDEKQPLTIKDLAINGNDLKLLGIGNGIEIGKVLKILLEVVHKNPEFNNYEILKHIIVSERDKWF